MPIKIIINDTSCLIDLRKAGLLTDILRLPYEFHVALPLVHDELADFSAAEWRALTARGMRVIDLDGAQVASALNLCQRYPALSVYDCFSLALAQATCEAMLLTGDRQLRRQAQQEGVEVHGVLWISDQLESLALVPFSALAAALAILQGDPLVYLPEPAVSERIARLRRKARDQ